MSHKILLQEVHIWLSVALLPTTFWTSVKCLFSYMTIISWWHLLLQGIVSVRAYGAEFEMHKVFSSLIDANHQSYILSVHMARWFGVRLDFATSVCITLASALVLLLRHSLSPGLAGILSNNSFLLLLTSWEFCTYIIIFARRWSKDKTNS